MHSPIKDVFTLDELTHLIEQRVSEATPSAPQVTASDVGVRVVGAFSAGKSRLISAMLAPFVERDFHPVSSEDRQTALPLKVTYGDEVSLEACDAQGASLKSLKHFPDRSELEGHPTWSSLCLKAPIPHLLTQDQRFNLAGTSEASAQGTEALCVSLIDTPGWNSGELAADQVEVATQEAPAVIFVTTSRLLDGRKEREEVLELLERLTDTIADRYLNVETVNVFFVVTRSGAHPTQAERGRSTAERAREFYQWVQDEFSSVSLCYHTPYLIDFEEMPHEEVKAQCEDLWRQLAKAFSGGQLELKAPEPPSADEVLAELFSGTTGELFMPILKALPLIDDLLSRWQKGARPFEELSEVTLKPHQETRRLKKLTDSLLSFLVGGTSSFDERRDERVRLITSPSSALLDTAQLPTSHPLKKWFEKTLDIELKGTIQALLSCYQLGALSVKRLAQDSSSEGLQRESARLEESLSTLQARYRELTVYLPILNACNEEQDPRRVLLTLFVAYHGRAQLRQALSA